ncbi:MAG: iron-sulfur cluster-binding domain-containing protein [Bacilli bacterium]|nr:iron-sulfur cluster-binding domain-containing protein [Bacilli bacterium]
MAKNDKIKISVHGFFKDALGSSRVTARRNKLIKEASDKVDYKDPIKDLVNELHPELTHVKVIDVEDVSPTARKFRFAADEGDVLPPFQCGQYASIEVEIDGTKTNRPYSISSAPYEARQGDKSFFELTIRNGRPETGYVSNWMYANVKVGDKFIARLPFGQFYYEPLRDAKKIVALAGGSGITPFLSMAREINHGKLDAELTILYGSVSSKDIILEKELEKEQSDKVRFINVISGEEDYKGEKGFLSSDIIKKYSEGDVTYFVCGPLPMYHFVRGELEKLNVPHRRIRMEIFGAPKDVSKAEGYPVGTEKKVFKVKVLRGIDEQEIEARADEPLTVALERAHVPNRARCRSGACGYCRCKVVEGKFFVPSEGDGRRLADKENDYVHACSTYPLSDMTIRIIIDK